MFICVCNFVTTFYLIKCVFTVFSTKYKRVFLAMVNKLAKNTLSVHTNSADVWRGSAGLCGSDQRKTDV